ncbi:MAG TPA: cob(I)yrinic acid a,c-diamide adenosyltransferase [Ignavibacteriales bacterium]|nr:cob(I)yrinic acid a,c-diamide adenosyltransferase [Ignavibacteriales bacterium]
MKKGYTHIYTGNGKGKTTAALGLAVRAAGSGFKTLFIHFMKNFDYSEIHGLFFLSQFIQMEQFGSDWFVVNRRPPTPEEISSIKAGLKRTEEAFNSNHYDVIVMDEIFPAFYFGVVTAEEIISVMKKKPENVELVLTGRYCPPEVMEHADLITEMKEVKHYYMQGVLSRKGIDC